MKRFFSKITGADVVLAAFFLSTILLGIGVTDKPLLAQVCPDCVTAKGRTTAGVGVPMQVDANGVLQTTTNLSLSGATITVGNIGINGISAVGGYWPSTFSGVAQPVSVGNFPSLYSVIFGATPTVNIGTLPNITFSGAQATTVGNFPSLYSVVFPTTPTVTVGNTVSAVLTTNPTITNTQFGVSGVAGTTWSQVTVTVTSGVTALLAADSTIRYLQVYNGNGTGNIYIAPFSPVSTTTGYKVGPAQANAPLSPPVNGLWAIGDIASNSGIVVTTGR